jgi:phenylacetate-CoA ligase
MVFSDSELLTRDGRRRIERAFGAPVFDVFGTFETDNIGYECGKHAGYHLAIDCVVVEFLRDGRPVAAGESGDLVCTVLNNLAMPLIRYKLGDIGSASTERCTCGRVFPLMNVVEGRSVDCVVMPDGSTRSPMKFLLGMDSLGDLALEYQVLQTAPERFLIRLVSARDLSSADRSLLAGLITAHHPRARVSIEQVAHIEREPSGKRRTFVCRV